MSIKRKWLLIIIVVALSTLVTTIFLRRGHSRHHVTFDAAWIASQARAYLDSRDDVPESIQTNILLGKIIEGMTPDEAVAAGGPFKYIIEDGGRVMVSVADIRYYFDYQKASPVQPRIPPDILWRQREEPSNVSIRLDFWNSTQFDTAAPIPFKVFFSGGRMSRIERFEDSVALVL
ncbi:MAG: hypothetical protein ACK4UN_08680 [Limisphaerales bacterium]